MSFLSSLFPALGAVAGGALGSVIPGLGTGIGAMIGGSLGGGLASNAATNAQTSAGNQALDLQRQMFAQTQANLQPYQQFGAQAIPQLNAMLGFGPQGMAGAQASLAATPGYQFARDQGINAILNHQSSLGGVLGGGTLTALDRYGTGLADQTYQSSVNNLFRAVGGGQNAAAGLGGFAANSANQQSDLLTGIGSAQSAGILGGAQGVAGGINNWLLANALQQGQGTNPSALAGWGGSAGNPWYG